MTLMRVRRDTKLLKLVHLQFVIRDMVSILITHVHIIVLFELLDVLPPLLLGFDSFFALD